MGISMVRISELATISNWMALRTIISKEVAPATTIKAAPTTIDKMVQVITRMPISREGAHTTRTTRSHGVVLAITEAEISGGASATTQIFPNDF